MPIAGRYEVRKTAYLGTGNSETVLRPNPSRAVVQFINANAAATSYLIYGEETDTNKMLRMGLDQVYELTYPKHGDLVLGAFSANLMAGTYLIILEVLEVPGSCILDRIGE